MGDVAMMVPVIRAFVEQHQNIKITILTRPFFKPFFNDLSNVSVFEADVDGRHKGIFGLQKLSKELKLLHIDAVADLHNVLRTNIIKFFLKPLPFVQIDKGRNEKKALTSGKIFHQLKSTHQRYADVFETLSFKVDLSKPSFPQKQSLHPKSKDLIGDFNTLVGIAPFAAFEGKTYPIALMEKVIDALEKQHKIILFGGGKEEIEQLGQLADRYENVISLAGKLDLKEELNVISNLNVMISMDSGNAHLAAMLGIKTITIWGVTHPFSGFYPFNQDIENAILADRSKFDQIPTSVYGKTFPNGYEKAIETISPKEIIEKVRAVLQ